MMKCFNDYVDLYNIQLKPGLKSVAQSEELFTARIEGQLVEFSMHDYRAMYTVPGLYDAMIYGLLNCGTPTNLSRKVAKYISEYSIVAYPLRVLDIGSGSGAFGEALRNAGIGETIWGLDIISEAKEAAERDRPGVYDWYVVDDLCSLKDENEHAIVEFSPNCVAVASATGWGNHIPVKGFENAFRLLEPSGLFVFHVKPNDPDPECIALNKWIEDKIMDSQIIEPARGSIFHRKSVNGNDIYYDFIIGRKSEEL